MSHAESKSKPDYSKPKWLPPLTVYYTICKRFEEKFHRSWSIYAQEKPWHICSVKPTCMMTSRTLIPNCLATCQSIARMLGICTALLFMLRAIFWLHERLFLRMKTSIATYLIERRHSSIWFTSCAAAITHCNYYFHQYHRNATPGNKELILLITVRESSKMQGPIMMKQLIALLHFSLSDLMSSGGFATAFLTGEVCYTSSF